ncbi:MAG: NPCBM/NEW2 domain-containing protein [Microbacterium sp.]
MSVLTRTRALARAAAIAATGALFAAGLALAAPAAAQAVVDPAIDLGDNADTPPMGFSTWNQFACDVDADLILQTAQAIVDSGMKDAGYEYINIDDCWAQTSRDEDGNLIADTEKFPDGIEGLADEIHALGLKLGIYSSAGSNTCQQVYPGSLGYEYIDAKNYYNWGVDYIKYDNCGDHTMSSDDFDADTTWLPEDIDTGEIDAERRYERMGLAIQQVQQEALAAGDEWNVVYSICEWGSNDPWIWGTSVGGSLWRTTGDISDSFASVLSILDQQSGLEDYSGPGAWNDPDMLEVGNGGMTVEEYRTHFSLWALLNAPLIAGNDIRLFDTEEERAADEDQAAYHDILTDPDVIAVDQDWGGSQGYLLRDDGDTQVWAKPMSDGESTAIVLLNRGLEDANISVTADELADAGLADSSAYAIDDLWSDSTTSTTGTIRAALTAHSSSMLIISPDEAAAEPSVSVEVTGDGYVEAGDSTTVDVTLHDDGTIGLTDVATSLEVPDGWTAEATGDTTASEVASSDDFTVEYTLTPDENAAIGDVPLTANVDYLIAGSTDQRTASGSYTLHYVDVPGEGTHYISDLDWVRSSNTGSTEVQRDLSTDGTELNQNGTAYEKGVGTQSPASVVVYLGGTCSVFQSLLGVQQAADSDEGNAGGGGPRGGSSTFEVYGDGELLYSSDSVSSTDDAVDTGDIDVTGVTALELATVDSGGFFTDSDKGNWLEAAVTCAAADDGSDDSEAGDDDSSSSDDSDASDDSASDDSSSDASDDSDDSEPLVPTGQDDATLPYTAGGAILLALLGGASLLAIRARRRHTDA